MSRNKKVIVIGLLAAVVLTAGIGGVAMARAGSYSPTGAAANQEVSANASRPLLGRVAEILGVDQAKLEAAFKQARAEQQLQALKNRLQRLVEAGKITQAQADAFLTWYQSKPDLTPYQDALRQWQQARPQVPDELKQWQEAKPDVPLQGIMGGKGMRIPKHRIGPMGGGMGARVPLLQGSPVQ